MFTFLLRLLLLIILSLSVATPSVTYSQVTIPVQKSLATVNATKEPYLSISYDNMLHLLQKLEKDDFEEQCSLADLERVYHLLAHLAKRGLLEQNSEEELTLESDIEELLEDIGEFQSCASYLYQDVSCVFMPNVSYEQGNAVLCKSWLRKPCRHIQKFIKKYKKEILIGAGVVVATTIVICIVTACPAAAAPIAAVGAGISNTDESDNNSEEISHLPNSQKMEIVETAIAEVIPDFKEIIVEDITLNDFDTIEQDSSFIENIRVLSSSLAHTILNESCNSQEELQRDLAHNRVDQAFATKQNNYYATNGTSFSEQAYQARGEHAFQRQRYEQAVHDFGKLIEINPNNHEAYLSRATTYLQMEEYDRCLEDYQTYIKQKPKPSDSIIGVPSHFAKGLAAGMWESGKELVSFTSSCLAHPINTSQEVWESLTTLADLAKSQEWSAIGEVVAPEVHHLITEWENLSSHERAELAGHAFGKLGGDILIPESAGKIISSGIKGAKELTKAAKCLKNAEQTLVLETLAETSVKKLNTLLETPWPLETIDSATAAALQRGTEKFKFTYRSSIHMTEKGRWVPVSLLEEVINNPITIIPDPRKISNADMYYSRILKNGKLYNIEVLYEKATNEISHFKYTDEPLGPLGEIKKNG